MKKPVILCDMGGVLIELNWLKHAKTLFNGRDTVEEAKRYWMSMKCGQLFESGRIGFEKFYKTFVEETGSKISFEEFQDQFDGTIGDLKPDCIEILKKLAGIGELAMLSNTNGRHVDKLSKSTNIFAPFKHLFFSHEMHLVKPDITIFQEVCRKLGRAPKEIFFFDDSKVNIEAAKKAGYNAYLVDNPTDIYKIVTKSSAFHTVKENK